MSAIAQASRPAPLNRRRRVRQKVHAPAYATFGAASSGEMLELNEILDISEVGLAVQCASPMPVEQQVDLCLDLAEARGQIFATARVVWSDPSGRVGLSLPALPNPSLRLLREWLFLNAMAGAANAASFDIPSPRSEATPVRPNYSDILTAASAVQREAESLGTDLEAILSLIASRSQFLLLASGAAIALSGTTPGSMISAAMICRAASGRCAPPVGAALQVDSGFSGECVRTATVLRCDDTESDLRVDRQSCRALGIRSMIAAPVRSGDDVIGLLEVFCAQPGAFGEDDTVVLQRFSETIAAAVNRAVLAADLVRDNSKPSGPIPGSVLFGQSLDAGAEPKKANDHPNDKVGGIHLPRAHLYLLITAAAAIALVLGILLAPWIHDKLKSGDASAEHTVLASSTPAVNSRSGNLSVDSASLDQLRQMARRGDSVAEDRLGRLYAEGDQKLGIKTDDKEAARWFLSAAEHGNVSAQYKIGLLYWGGHHGLPKDINKAYFWTVLARAGGQESSKDLATFLASNMTRAQAAAIEQQANIWYQQHESNAKPSPAR